jgi:tetratricopeptide (TPR) repeat protein
MAGTDGGSTSEPASSATTRTSAAHDSAAGEAPPVFSVGDQLAGRFRIVRFIARGGMGEVYEAEDLDLGGNVALKTVRLAGRDARAIERFRSEIQLARRVTHPNVCRTFDVFHHRPDPGTDEGEVTLLSMELLEGETLADRIPRCGRLPPGEALALGRQMAAALDAAHRAGVVHRDFKSRNVVLVQGPDGERAVVTDFGLARPVPGPGGSTTATTDTLVGTPDYMAPEQVEGARVTPAVDVYAFGIVLYEMVTGKRPFSGDTPTAVMVKRLTDSPPSPRRLVPDLEPSWEAAILRCLERDPAARFASAGEAVRAIESGRLVKATVRRRGRLPALVLGVVLAGLAGAFVGLVIHGRRGSPAPAGREAVVPRRSIAVLGFKNLSGRPEAAWLSTAVSEMLGSELGAGEALRIVAGENVARMKTELTLADADALAADTLARVRNYLGSDLVVLGSYAVVGGRIRLDLRMQDVQAGETTASLSETGTEADLFDVVARLGARLRERLGAAPLTADEASRARGAMPADPEAARLYSESLDRLRVFDALGARERLERAVAIAPEHPLVHSALAAAWTSLGYEARARDEAKKAFELSEGLPRSDRLAVEARYRETTSEWDKAIDIYRSLVRFYPDDLGYGLRLADVQDQAGRGRDALASLEELRKLPPPSGDDPRIDLAEAAAARYLSESVRSVAAARRAATKAESRGERQLLARARFEEGSALQNSGEPDAAAAALDGARRLFAESGNQQGVAVSLMNLSIIDLSRGDLKASRQKCEEARALYRSLGNRAGEAGAESNIANVLSSAGDSAGALRTWEAALVVFREVDDKYGVATTLENIGATFADRGDLAVARARFDEALLVWRQIGNRSGEASTLQSVGKTLFETGDIPGAEERYREAVAILTEIGDKTTAAYALHDYGDLLRCRGDLVAARARYQEALALREAMGEKVNTAFTRVALADLSVEEGRPSDAEAPARQAAEQFAKEALAREEGWARLVLGRALLARGETASARSEAERIVALAGQGDDRSLRAAAKVLQARVLVASGARGEQLSAMQALRRLLAGRERPLSAQSRFEVRLALAELESRRDPRAAGRDLAALEAEARAKGFGLVAARAASAGAAR